MGFKNKFEKFYYQQILALKKLEKIKGRRATEKEIIKCLLFDVLSFIEKQKPGDLIRWFGVAKELKRAKKRQLKVNKILKGTPTSVNNISQMIQRLSTHMANTYFSTRKKLNDEFVEYVGIKNSGIPEIQEFWNYIQGIQVNFNVPELVPSEDVQYYTKYLTDGTEYTDCNSMWLNSQGAGKQENFKKEINGLVERYNLSAVFFDWFWWFVLYNEIPPWKPSYNWELINDERNIGKIAITTGEKNYLRNFSTDNFGNDRRRPMKKMAEKSKKINKMLKVYGKEKRKPFLTSETALKTLEKIGEEADPFLSITTSYKKTYKDMAEELGKKPGALRKQNERLKKRITKIMKLNKLKK